ncbi:MAG: hypothetical protein J2P55_00685 [Rhizobiales bacterium]|nr:hypothetical protein [Hyphomicrobiales bacterium]
MIVREPVLITCEGRTVPGFIVLASENRKSLMIEFEAMLAGHVGSMALLQDDDGVYRSLINRVEVTIRPRESGGDGGE